MCRWWLPLAWSLVGCGVPALPLDDEGMLIGTVSSTADKADGEVGVLGWELRDLGDALVLRGMGADGTALAVRIDGGDTDPDTLDRFSFTLTVPNDGAVVVSEAGTIEGTLGSVSEGTQETLVELYADLQTIPRDEAGKADRSEAGPKSCDPTWVVMYAVGTAASLATLGYLCWQSGGLACLAFSSLTAVEAEFWTLWTGVALALEVSRYRTCTRLRDEFPGLPKATLVGTVTSAGRPLEGWAVYVDSPSTGWLGPAVSDAAGNFAFTNLPHGVYRLAVYRRGERAVVLEDTLEVPHAPLVIAIP